MKELRWSLRSEIQSMSILKAAEDARNRCLCSTCIG